MGRQSRGQNWSANTTKPLVYDLVNLPCMDTFPWKNLCSEEWLSTYMVWLHNELHLDCTHPFQSCLGIDNEINNNITQEHKDSHNISIQLEFPLPQDTMNCIKQTETCKKCWSHMYMYISTRTFLLTCKHSVCWLIFRVWLSGIDECNVLKRPDVSYFTQTFNKNKPLIK